MLTTPAVVHAPARPIDVARIECLIIVRQSGVGAWDDLRKMLERILTSNSGVPGYTQLRELGLTPLEDEVNFTERWSHTGGTRAVLYSVEGTHVLLVLGSLTAYNVAADEASEMEDNFVVSLYGQVLRALRPRVVITGPFDRIVRAYEFGPETFQHFNASGVEYLLHDGGDLEFGTDTAMAEWESLSVDAAAALRTIRRRLLQGQMSTVRDNGWPLSSHQAPPGLSRVDDRALGVHEQEAEVVLEVARMISEPGYSIADIAKTVASSGRLPRRCGTEGIRKRRGVEFATSSRAATGRARKFVERVMLTLPDLAMGKYVSSRRTAHSIETMFIGARRERTEKGYVHWLVWSVPDLFHDMDEETLLEAVAVCAAYRISRHLPASPYLHEMEQRDRAQQLLDADEDTVETRQVKRWAGTSGRMLHAMGNTEPELPRSPLVRDAIARAEQGHRKFVRAQNSTSQSLFSKWPAWRQGDTEYLLSSGLVNNAYTLLTRPFDPSKTPNDSRRRAWSLKKGVRDDNRVVATMPMGTFHSTLARAIANAIESGVPALHNQHLATAHVRDASRDRRLHRLATLQTLENDLRAATDRADAALEMVLNLNQRRLAWERTAAQVDAASDSGQPVVSLPGGLDSSAAMSEVLQRKADEAFVRVEQARQRLIDFQAHSVESDHFTPPSMSDMDLVLDTLVSIATRTTASPRECRILQALFTRLRVENVDALTVTFSIDVLLPGGQSDTELVAGPIRVPIPTNGYRRTGNVTQPHAYAEAYCLNGHLPEHSPTSLNGTVKDPRKEVRRTIARFFIKEHGLHASAATAIVGHPLPLVRRIAFLLVTDTQSEPSTLDVTPQFLALFRATYLSGDIPEVPRDGGAGARYRQNMLDLLVRAGDRGMTIAVLTELTGDDLPSKTVRQRDNAIRRRLFSLPDRWDSPWTTPATATVRAIECPHCHAPDDSQFVDTIAWLPEVPGGLLCSRCLKTPRANSITYPDEYRSLSATHRLHDASTPVASNGPRRRKG